MTRGTLTEIADQFQYWVKSRSEKWAVPIVDAPEEERRDDFVLKYLQHAPADQVAVILKGREPARILVAIGGKDNDSPHLELKQRWVNQYNFYLNDKHWGPMFVRMCLYFPFSARVCLDQHYWLAIRMRQEKDRFPAVQERLPAVLTSATIARAGRLLAGARSAAVRAQVADRLHSLLHRPRTTTSRLSPPPVLLPSRVL